MEKQREISKWQLRMRVRKLKSRSVDGIRSEKIKFGREWWEKGDW